MVHGVVVYVVIVSHLDDDTQNRSVAKSMLKVYKGIVLKSSKSLRRGIGNGPHVHACPSQPHTIVSLTSRVISVLHTSTGEVILHKGI